jgi:hypothetical protein
VQERLGGDLVGGGVDIGPVPLDLGVDRLDPLPDRPGRSMQRPATSSLYQRIQYAGGLRRLVNGLYPRVLADPC